MTAHTRDHASKHAYSGEDDIHAYITHNQIQGLTTGDPHTQYALLAGRAGGQDFVGGTGSGDDLVLESTSHGTKGDVAINNGSDLVVYSDDLTTEKARIDAATGNITTSGTVDGVDVATLKSDYDTHVGGTAKAQHTGGLGTHTHQSAGAEGGKIDHGLALDGLGDDDHTQYALLAGRAGGQTIIGGTGAGDDLTLNSTSHGTKGNVKIAAGSELQMTSNKIVGLATPTAGTDAANKDYVDAIAGGVHWQAAVLDKDLTAAPGVPSTGDRYIVGVSAEVDIEAINQGTKTISILGNQTANIVTGDIIHVSWSTGNNGWYTVVSVTWNDPNTDIVVSEAVPDATADGVVEYADTGDDWVTDEASGPGVIAEYDGADWGYVRPSEGFATYVIDEDVAYIYGDDAVWVKMSSIIEHNNLSGLQGGTTNEFYHMTSAQFSALTGGGDIGDTYHDHDSLYYDKTDFVDTDGDAAAPVKTKAAGHLDHTLIKEIMHYDQAAEPTIQNNEVCIWTDSDGGDQTWLIFRFEGTQLKVELT